LKNKPLAPFKPGRHFLSPPRNLKLFHVFVVTPFKIVEAQRVPNPMTEIYQLIMCNTRPK